MKIIPKMTETHVYKIVKNKTKFLVLKRSESESYPGLWQMVTGSVMQGETAVDAAIRELKEETNLKPKKMWIVPNINSYYEPETNEILIIPVFLILVDENSSVMISDEHTKYKWLSGKKASNLFSWPGQKKSLEVINQFLNNSESRLKFVEIKI
jgi:dATP pyrophosphohydrolase